MVVIDNNETVLQRCEDALDVMCIQGNGANARTLMDAGVDKADILVAATASDEINMLCCLIAKRLGAQYTIARIRDPEYNASLTLLQHETGVDMAVNPERATAMEISRLLRFPFANNIEYFARGQVEMVEFRAQEKDIMVGCPLAQAQLAYAGNSPGAVCRGGAGGARDHPQWRLCYSARGPGARGRGNDDRYQLLPLSGQAFPAH